MPGVARLLQLTTTAAACAAILTGCGSGLASPLPTVNPAIAGAINSSLPAAQSATLKYAIVDLGANVYPAAINTGGMVVGREGTPFRAFSYTAGTMHVYGVLPGDAVSGANDVNDSGEIVGYSGQHAVVFSSTSITDLGGLSGYDANSASAISNRGEIVGHSAATSGAVYPCDGPAVIFDGHGGAQALSIPSATYGDADARAVNAAGAIVGMACLSDPDNYAPFEYPANSALPADNGCPVTGTHNSANDINTAGDVAGVYATASCANHGFLLKNNRLIDIPAPGGDPSINSFATAVNDGDWVVGAGGPHAMLYAKGSVYDLNALTTGAGCQLWTLQVATDINDSGQIVGTAALNGVEHGFLLVPQQ